MSCDPLTLLAQANPVKEVLEVPPVESLDYLAVDPSVRGLSRRLRFALLGAGGGLALALVTLFVLALAGPSSSPGVDVAAAAYAATSSGSGVIEAEFVERLSDAHGGSVWHREWIQASSGRRREQLELPEFLLGPRQGSHGPRRRSEFEVATSPGWVEVWKGGTISRFRDGSRASEGTLPEGIALYRRLYEERSLRLAGHEMLNGRRLWRLEGDLVFVRASAGGRTLAVFGEVVLVDPRTYLPVVEREVNLKRPGHPTIAETRLLRYRRLPPGPSSEALLELKAPAATIRNETRQHEPASRALRSGR